MGFQAGTQVDPRLLDYSGYAQGVTQGAALKAAALTQVGASIAEAKEKKEKKKATVQLMSGMIKSMPELKQLTGMDQVMDATDADYTQAASALYDSFGEDMSSKVTLLALSSLFDDTDTSVAPSTFAKAKEELEEEGIEFPKGGDPVRRVEKGSYLNVLSRFLGGRALDIDATNPFGFDKFVPVGEDDPSVRAIEGGKQVIRSRTYNPISLLDK